MKTATLEDISLLRHYFSAEPRHLCTYTPGVLVMWREYFRLALSECDGTLLVRLAYNGQEDAYLFPLGRDPEAAVTALYARAERKGTPLLFAGLTDADRDRLLALYPNAEVTADRGEADYLYRTDELAAFPGRRFGGQRNHVHKFERLYPDFTVTDLTPADHDELAAFLDGFAARHADRPLLAEELDMTREVLANYATYGMDGIVLRAEGRIAAFAVGEVIGDMLSVHIEKADVSYHGAYQMIVREFSRYACTDEIGYINREDDAGDEGLRKSKLAWRPCGLLDKYLVHID